MSRRAIIAGKAVIVVEAKNLVDRTLKTIEARMKKFSNTISSISDKMLVGGFLGSLMSGTITREFKNFDDAILELQVSLGMLNPIAREANKEFVELENEIRRLGKSTTFTTTTITSAAVALAKAGLPAKEITKSLGSVLDLSRGTATELEVATKIFIRAVRAFYKNSQDFSKAIEESQKLTSQFVIAVRSGVLDLYDLESAMRYVQGTTGNLNEKLTTTLALLIELANRGLVGSIGGTSLNTAILNIIKKAEELSEMGVQIEITQGDSGVDVLGTINNFLAAIEDLDLVTKQRILSDVFNIRGGRAIRALADSIKNVEELREKLEKATDEARKSARIMDSGVGGSLRLATSAAQDLAITLEQNVKKELVGILQMFRELVNTISSLSSGNNLLSAGIIFGPPLLIATAIALKGLAAAFGLAATAVGIFRGGLSKLGSLLAKGTAGQIIVLQKAVTGLSAALKSIPELSKLYPRGLIRGIFELRAMNKELDILGKKMAGLNALQSAVERRRESLLGLMFPVKGPKRTVKAAGPTSLLGLPHIVRAQAPTQPRPLGLPAPLSPPRLPLQPEFPKLVQYTKLSETGEGMRRLLLTNYGKLLPKDFHKYTEDQVRALFEFYTTLRNNLVESATRPLGLPAPNFPSSRNILFGKGFIVRTEDMLPEGISPFIRPAVGESPYRIRKQLPAVIPPRPKPRPRRVRPDTSYSFKFTPEKQPPEIESTEPSPFRREAKKQLPAVIPRERIDLAANIRREFEGQIDKLSELRQKANKDYAELLGQFTKKQAAVQRLSTSIGESILKGFTNALKSLGRGVWSLRKVFSISGITTVIELLLAFTDAGERVFGAIGSYLKDIFTTFKLIVGPIKEIMAGFKLIGEARELESFNKKMAETAKGTGLFLIKDGLNSILSIIKDQFSAAWDGFVARLGWVYTLVVKVKDALMLALEIVFEVVKALAGTVFSQLFGMVQSLTGGKGGDFGSKVLRWAQVLLEGFVKVIFFLLQKLQDLFIKFWDAVQALDKVLDKRLGWLWKANDPQVYDEIRNPFQRRKAELESAERMILERTRKLFQERIDFTERERRAEEARRRAIERSRLSAQRAQGADFLIKRQRDELYQTYLRELAAQKQIVEEQQKGRALAAATQATTVSIARAVVGFAHELRGNVLQAGIPIEKQQLEEQKKQTEYLRRIAKDRGLLFSQ